MTRLNVNADLLIPWREEPSTRFYFLSICCFVGGGGGEKEKKKIWENRKE